MITDSFYLFMQHYFSYKARGRPLSTGVRAWSYLLAFMKLAGTAVPVEV